MNDLEDKLAKKEAQLNEAKVTSEQFKKEVHSLKSNMSSFESFKSKHSKCQGNIDELRIQLGEYKKANALYDKRLLKKVVKIQRLTGKDHETTSSASEDD